MAQTVIAKFKLVSPEMGDQWKELSNQIQAGISQADGFISRDTGVDEEGNLYCIVKFESKEQREANMKTAMENFPALFEKFTEVVDMSTMTKTEINLN
jgi:antibiotic biosynthesis monooxygenase (ABM) superfamily enzyme